MTAEKFRMRAGIKEASRHIIAMLNGQETTPQALIRVDVAPSTANAPPATPRRPLKEVLIVRR